MEKYIVEMKGISKRFPGVLALDNVSLKLRPGETLTLVGENGAGKSTLMKCLIGIYRPDEGQIVFDGKEVAFNTPSDALTIGISMIHQEISPVLDRSVMHNIWLGREPLNKFHLVDHKEMYRKTQELLEFLEIEIDSNEIVGRLTVAKMQMVEIAKALSYDSKVIIMDEPTSALTNKEAEQLFSIIDKLKARDVAIIYISHKMNEIFHLSDVVAVLRDGKNVETMSASETDPESIINLMVGRKLDNFFPKVDVPIGEVCLEVRNLHCEGYCKEVSFSLRKGEILGIAGLVGAGRTESMEALFGIRPKTSGQILLNGKEIQIETPKDAIRHGLAFLTEDRRATGIYPMLSVMYNTTIANLARYKSRARLLKTEVMRKDVETYIEKLAVKTPYLHTLIQNLSGGNQQKVLIARWLLTEPDILILDEPTRGIDVGAKAEIHKLVSQMVSEGKSIIMISSELPEIIATCDRVLVMHEGKLTGELERSELSQESIMRLAFNQ